MAKVLIIGASQGIGLQATRIALKRGHSVRAFARRAGSIDLDHPSLEKRNGDARDRGDVTAALEGVDAVVQALGVPANADMVLRPVRLFSEATEILISAMEGAGVRRLASVTGFGAGDSRARIGCLQRIPFTLALGRAYDDKSVQERLIRDSGLDWIIARPVILTNGPRTGRYRILAEPEKWRNGFISRSDVADFLVAQVDDDTYLRQTPVLVRCPL